MKATAFMVALSVVLFSTAVLAEVPGLMNYQGTLTDVDGVALDTTVSMTFSIYTDSTGGSSLWTETQSSVVVDHGLFNVLLGRVNANGASRWLGVQVGVDPELAPRQRIASVGYAFQAAEADTADYSRKALAVDDGDWTISGSNIYSAVSGNVGIGTATPARKLDVQTTGGIGIYVENDHATLAALYARNYSTGPAARFQTGDVLVQYGDVLVNYGKVGIGTLTPGCALEVRNSSGTAVRAYATGSSGYGVDAYSSSPTGIAVYGFNEAESGNAYAVYGENISPNGIAIYGLADNGDTYSTGIGVYGRSDSDNPGIGVYGEVTNTGTTYGVRGVSAHGTGVRGDNTDTGNQGSLGRPNEGVFGYTILQDGMAVRGQASYSSLGYSYGGYFEAASSLGRGVHGEVSGLYGYGVYGRATGDYGRGVVGEADGIHGWGVWGESHGDSGRAVFGEAHSGGTGGYFSTSGSTARAVYGVAASSGTGGYFEATGLTGRGVHGFADGDNGRGVMGEATERDGIGVYGTADGIYGIGVYGAATDNTGSVHYGGYFTADGAGHALYAKIAGNNSSSRAIYAENLTTSELEHYAGYFRATSNEARAVYGLADRTGAGSETTYGGYFESRANWGVGVYGGTTNPYYAGAGVLGEAFGEGSAGIKGVNSGSSWAGYFDGPIYSKGSAEVSDDLHVGGELDVGGIVTGGAGSFKIDHPLDPKNKYLTHSFVESPDMMNVYNGNVVTDAGGEAWVQLPDWFQALNRDFRYQLTVIGQFAQAIVAEKIEGNRFLIRTDKPNTEVSWQITGIRQDPYAEANRIQIEVEKPAEERGSYLHPEAWGQPAELHVDRFRDALKEALEN